jgi:hypothetical protein
MIPLEQKLPGFNKHCAAIINCAGDCSVYVEHQYKVCRVMVPITFRLIISSMRVGSIGNEERFHT